MKPIDVDAALALVRAKATEWQENADRTRAAGTGESWGWQLDRMGERDDIGMELVEAWQVLDGTITSNHGIARPVAWRVPQLTDEQFAAVFADWPELAAFGEDLVKDMSRHVGIRYVRWLAQRALKNAPALAAEERARP